MKPLILATLTLSKEKRNLLNHHDESRFIQQSYYGDPDGSKWGEKPWVYNPVQGGSYKGEDAGVPQNRWRPLRQGRAAALGERPSMPGSHHAGVDHARRRGR